MSVSARAFVQLRRAIKLTQMNSLVTRSTLPPYDRRTSLVSIFLSFATGEAYLLRKAPRQSAAAGWSVRVKEQST